MSSEAITLIGSLLGVAVVMGVAIYLWMNRTPRVRRDDDGRLPLFGGDFDVDVEGNPLTPPPRRLPPPVVLPTLTTAFARPAPAGPPADHPAPASADPQSGLERSAAASKAADVTTERAAQDPTNEGMLSSIDVFPSPLMPPPVPRSMSPVSNPAQPAPRRSPGPSPVIRTFTTANPTAGGSPTSPAAPRPTAEPRASAARATERSGTPVAANGIPGTMVEGHLLRFSVPAEGTLQFLPGRLQIAAGRDAGREIRFVRVPGVDDAEVTFGRSEGELYRHIQLRDQTVSRSHARMRLVDGTWHLLNLSQTNPVVHNGRALTGGEEQAVVDGDRIEMGEVLFTFRSR
jgi:Inner membrane component of T3SS, cytoplasmic domain